MEAMVSDLCWPGGRREADGLTRAAARVRTQPFLPAVDTEPACIDCSVFPARFNVGVVHVPGALYELTLEGAMIALLTVVAYVCALVVCVSWRRVSVMMGGTRMTILFTDLPRLLPLSIALLAFKTAL